MKRMLAVKLNDLDIKEKRELKNLKACPYLCDQMNAHVLKQ
jgi:hypothetical protein